MKPDFVSQSLWDALPDDWQEELLLESGRQLRHGVLREQAFMNACSAVLLDEVWTFCGVDDIEPPTIWPMLVEDDVARRHPALLRGIHLLGLSRTQPLVIAKLKDSPEQVFYLSDERGPEEDCPHCGLVLRDDEKQGDGNEFVHAECAQDFAAVREELGRRLIEASLLESGEAEEEPEEEDVLDELPGILDAVFGASGQEDRF
jgi:hypothetical protein